ncbi:MAG: ribosome-binding factor A [Candidatus Colwellbacteria bacterium RIFCSPLOWO2_01_FULL_48_10]|uniref:Ribosome-binding factor A n=2 Tax=Bacteria candidate phyla TaxID=1783234 RepID=A0A1F5P3W6_9BACT|nr:MAG: ribosome-binding factor A [Candidatus Doudnabacteria bacterium RIFCSPHIGHO2_01_FULL_49_9]OGY59942.1 MAG: ribosome-binding factor A [Candidatus Colwellbacteria bacterium RIFCSPLOWO2_01_FULL_48_10]
MNSYRSERLASVMQAELSKLILKEIDVPPGVLPTINSIEFSSDTKNARVGVAVYPEARAKEIIKNLQSSAGRLHYLLIRIMNIRTVPILEFFLDRGMENAAAVEKVFMKPVFRGGRSAKKGDIEKPYFAKVSKGKKVDKDSQNR